MLPNHKITFFLLNLLLVISSEPVSALVNISFFHLFHPYICNRTTSKIDNFSRMNLCLLKEINIISMSCLEHLSVLKSFSPLNLVYCAFCSGLKFLVMTGGAIMNGNLFKP